MARCVCAMCVLYLHVLRTFIFVSGEYTREHEPHVRRIPIPPIAKRIDFVLRNNHLENKRKQNVELVCVCANGFNICYALRMHKWYLEEKQFQPRKKAETFATKKKEERQQHSIDIQFCVRAHFRICTINAV